MIMTDPFRCDHVGCDEMHTTQNGWWVVLRLKLRPIVKIVPFLSASEIEMKDGKHFCGQTHAMLYASGLMGEITVASKVPKPTKEAALCSGSSQPLKQDSGLDGLAPVSAGESESSPHSLKAPEV